MTFEYVERELKAFLRNHHPSVLAIKGSWGVGKTHLVRECLKAAATDYAYVSLFGVNSLEGLREDIFAELLSKRATEKDIKQFSKPFQEFLDKAGNIGNLTKTAIKIWMSLDFDSGIVCVDDIERKGEELSLRDLLGFLFQLKEQKSFRVILILNENELEEQKELNTYREKLIDREIELAPVPDKIIEIGLEEKNDGVVDILRKLEVNNIRAVSKVESFLKRLRGVIKGYDAEVESYVIHQATILAWFYFNREKSIMPWSFIQTFDSWNSSIRGDRFPLSKRKGETELSEEQVEKKKDEETYMNRLHEIGYHKTGTLEKAIIQALERGASTEEQFADDLKNLDERFKLSKADNQLRDAWNIFHSSFKDNAGEFIQALIECFRKNSVYYEPRSLAAAKEIAIQLGYENEAEMMVSDYFSIRQSFQPSPFSSFDVQDPEIRSRIEELQKQSIQLKDKREVFEAVILGSWSNQDFEALKLLSEDDWYHLFQKEFGSGDNNEVFRLSTYVKRVHDFISVDDARMKEVAKRARKALARIAEEAKINEIRLEGWLS